MLKGPRARLAGHQHRRHDRHIGAIDDHTAFAAQHIGCNRWSRRGCERDAPARDRGHRARGRMDPAGPRNRLGQVGDRHGGGHQRPGERIRTRTGGVRRDAARGARPSRGTCLGVEERHPHRDGGRRDADRRLHRRHLHERGSGADPELPHRVPRLRTQVRRAARGRSQFEPFGLRRRRRRHQDPDAHRDQRYTRAYLGAARQGDQPGLARSVAQRRGQGEARPVPQGLRRSPARWQLHRHRTLGLRPGAGRGADFLPSPASRSRSSSCLPTISCR